MLETPFLYILCAFKSHNIHSTLLPDHVHLNEISEIHLRFSEIIQKKGLSLVVPHFYHSVV